MWAKSIVMQILTIMLVLYFSGPIFKGREQKFLKERQMASRKVLPSPMEESQV